METTETAEICALTPEAVTKLLVGRTPTAPDSDHKGRRKVGRWPFPGTVELWIPDEFGIERHALATSLNLSLHGVGIRSDEPLSPGLELPIAIHEPEVSFHGRAIVRHCAEIEEDYLIGLEFVYDAA